MGRHTGGVTMRGKWAGTLRVAVVGAAVVATIGVSATAGAATDTKATRAASSDTTITIYNAQHVALTEAWAKDFTAKTGIQVQMRNGKDYELANQIVAEGSASPADIFLTENSP